VSHFKTIYASRAADYQRMIGYEDYRGLLLPTLDSIRPLAGLDVVEFGAGTGRLSVLLAPSVRCLRAYDASPHMLAVARRRLAATGRRNWRLGVADNAHLPAPDACAGLAGEGWSFGHLTGWYPDTWREEARGPLAEMRRVLRPGGTAVVIETLGTGVESPQPPNAALAALYALLEGEYGFQRVWIRTDYAFPSPEVAAEATRFFFGDELADRLLAERRTILPECTGLWWRTF
jgi:ubiquinone/menaquinone biosynthesis C-methylase UbiE